MISKKKCCVAFSMVFTVLLLAGCGNSVSKEFAAAEDNFRAAHKKVQSLLETGIDYSSPCIVYHPFTNQAKDACRGLENALHQMKYVAYATSENENDKARYNSIDQSKARNDLEKLNKRVNSFSHDFKYNCGIW